MKKPLLVGIDFDNTIVSYDTVFHSIAVERGLIPSSVLKSKEAVRNTLRAQGQEEEWIELQGLVYGKRIDEAEAFEGFFDFVHWAKDAGVELAIISHKTRYPFRGPQYDLHEAARGWLTYHKLLVSQGGKISDSLVFFNEEKEQKISKINELQCDLFIDDLPEILLFPTLSENIQKFLFDPSSLGKENKAYIRFPSWSSIQESLKRSI